MQKYFPALLFSIVCTLMLVSVKQTEATGLHRAVRCVGYQNQDLTFQPPVNAELEVQQDDSSTSAHEKNLRRDTPQYDYVNRPVILQYSDFRQGNAAQHAPRYLIIRTIRI